MLFERAKKKGWISHIDTQALWTDAQDAKIHLIRFVQAGILKINENEFGKFDYVPGKPTNTFKPIKQSIL